MTPLARALVGVALGSCLTLFLHHLSRPYMTGLVPRPTDAASIREVSGAGTGPLDAPQSVAEIGLWMQLGCSRLAAGQKLSKEELQSLLQLADLAEKTKLPAQFNNAFWPQMQAVFYDQLGDRAKAEQAWLKATACENWNDYQSTRLLQKADDLQSPLAWHFAGLYYQRRHSVGQAILDYARRAIDQAGQETPRDLEFRYATLVNAHHLAVGARSVDMLDFASLISDTAIQPPHTEPITDNALREKARGKLTDALDRMGEHEQAASAKRDFSDIDGKIAETQPFKPADTAARLAIESIATASLPDALLIIAAIGAVAWPLGHLLLRFSLDHSSISWMPAIGFGCVLGIGAIWLALPPLAGLVGLLCAVLLIFTPKNERSRLPSDLGLMFTWTIGILSVLFVFSIAACLAALSTPAKLILPSILHENPMMIGNQFGLVLGGVAALVFALLLLVSPMWAFARRVRTPFVLGLAFRTFGIMLVAIGLGGTVILGPLCIYADSQAKKTMARLVGNEPEHYYEQFQ